MANELLQLFSANRLRRKLPLKLLGNFVEARLAIEHLQNGELFLLEPKVLQRNRVLHHPINPPLIPLSLTRLQIGPHTNGQRAGRARNERFGRGWTTECGGAELRNAE